MYNLCSGWTEKSVKAEREKLITYEIERNSRLPICALSWWKCHFNSRSNYSAIIKIASQFWICHFCNIPTIWNGKFVIQVDYNELARHMRQKMSL